MSDVFLQIEKAHNERMNCGMSWQERSVKGIGAGKEEVAKGLRKEQNEVARHILGISEQVMNFVDEKGWSWDDMEKVYRVLRVIREG